MDSRQNSIGGGSQTPSAGDNANRSRASTPSLSWGSSARSDSFASLGSPGILRAGASAFMPRNTASPSSRLRFLSMTSTDDTVENNDSPTIVTSAPRGTNVIQPIGTPGSSKSPVHAKTWFTTDISTSKPAMNGHFVLIQGVKDRDLNTGVAALIEKDFFSHIVGKKLIKHAPDAEHTDIVLFLDDVRMASNIYDFLECEGQVTVSFVSFDWYNSSKALRVRGPDVVTMYVAQVTLVAEFKGRTTDFDPTVNIHDKVREIAGTYGDVLAFEQNKSAQYPLAQFRVEYYKVSAADLAMKTAKSGIKFDNMPGWTIFTKQYVVPSDSPAVHVAQPAPLVLSTVPAADAPANGSPADGAEIITSPTGRTAWYTDSQGVDHPVPPPRPVATVNRENEPPAGYHAPASHNSNEVVRRERMVTFDAPPAARRPLLGFDNNEAVNTNTYVPQGNEVTLYHASNIVDSSFDDNKPTSDIIPGRIYQGTDVRTTVMMRNIPPSWDWKRFKAALDEACAGRYSFMYLRMDFKRAENVGYAFVNFESAEDIVDFLECWHGKRWDPTDYRFPKPVECSYATIQGLDQLIEKFRNSSVMDEHADYRPMLFQTAGEKAKEEAEVAHLKSRGLPTGGRICEVGEKKVFPAWNNRAKKERSTANAGHIGLFAPKFQRFNNGSRRYRGQFDRGNPAEYVHNQPWIAPPSTPYPAMGYGVPATPFTGPRGGPFAGPSAAPFAGPSVTPFAGPPAAPYGVPQPGPYGMPQPMPYTGAGNQAMVPPHVANFNFGPPRFQAVYPPNMGTAMQPTPYGFVAYPFTPGYAPPMPANRDGRDSSNGAGGSGDADDKSSDDGRH